MGAAREKVQADFDLERFIDMFDEALTSKDERVINALRSLMMMVILTKPEGRDQAGDGDKGPLRQLYDDLHHLNRRMHDVENVLRQMEYQYRKEYENRTYSARDYWPQADSITMSQADYEAKMRSAFQKINSPGRV